MIRVGFIIGDASWSGGINYIRNLICALDTVCDSIIEPVLITTLPNGCTNLLPHRLQQCEVIHYSPPATRLTSIANNKFRQYFGVDIHLESFLKRNRVALVSHATGLMGISLPTICWIPDFQHLRRPDFFDANEVAARVKSQHKLCAKAAGIIVSSQDALNDLASFYPQAANRAMVLRFVAPAPETRHLSKREGLATRYNIALPFFHIPNQFWKHKNHTLVLDALSILKTQKFKTQVVCTGDTVDPRHPKHFQELMGKANALGVSDCFTVLGNVPYEDVMSLMLNSAAVINPSFFEGWSSTVEEGKSMGKRVILSNIPVHMEQAPPRSLFVSPTDPTELAAAMLDVLELFDERDEAVAAHKAQETFLQRQREFGQTYHQYILHIVSQLRVPQSLHCTKQ